MESAYVEMVFVIPDTRRFRNQNVVFLVLENQTACAEEGGGALFTKVYQLDVYFIYKLSEQYFISIEFLGCERKSLTYRHTRCGLVIKSSSFKSFKEILS